MKRIKGILSKNYKCPKLYLEDIEKIFEILNEAEIKNINLRADGYSYNNLEELEEKKKKVRDLYIETDQPHIKIEFLRDSAQFYIFSDDLKSRGIFSSVNEIISRRERKLLWILTAYDLFIIILISIILTFTRFFKEDPHYIIKNILIISLGAILLWTPISILVHWKYFSIIDLIRKDKISNFFIRNKDNIIISIISTITGTIIGIFLGIAIQGFFLP